MDTSLLSRKLIHTENTIEREKSYIFYPPILINIEEIFFMEEPKQSIDVIKKMPFVHCARGPALCKECQHLSQDEPTFALVRIYLEPVDYACPMTEIIKDGKKIFGAYAIIQRFDDIIDAKNYAKEKNLEIYLY